MTDYFILEKVQCDNCLSTGLYTSQVYHPVTGQELAREENCVDCKGKGFKLEPVEIDQDLLVEIRRNFMGDHNA